MERSMTTLSIELDEAERQQLRDLAAAEGRAEPEICREAVKDYLRRHDRATPEPSSDPYEPLRKMIGLVKKGEGRTDSSIFHDYRPGDPI
jgi:hypothetical protein